VAHVIPSLGAKVLARRGAETGSDIFGSLLAIRCDGRDRKSGRPVRGGWLAPSFALLSIEPPPFASFFSIISVTICAVVGAMHFISSITRLFFFFFFGALC
jgi:hypothetical protein